MSITKSRAVFYLICGGITAVFAALFLLFTGVWRVITVILAVIITALWCAYFSSLRYEICGDMVVVKSGVIVRRTQKIALSEVIFETRVGIAGSVFLTVLRTAGGKAVLFGRLNGS